ncbi:hypothetical protein G8V07_14305 [Clostridium botulinum D/C]|uniref:hypothetical protein n=1 Tax=Clostridium botulinum TaxID=1491 RepID=UPI001E2D7878|nr:hypothetical protein [Clostridium botulinum]MCD3321638.1 hypothetical protein [Clostridium botulinum D/C]MCD3324897.1 hypothetical protein [Clostridium botulinum D/C]MCD3328164.1 hypothetical protein [Clostridium botulinum D/C]
MSKKQERVQVGFSYGVFYPSLEEQANKQGFTLGNEAETVEKIRKAINMCGFHVATDAQVNSMLKKLNKRVAENLQGLDK